MLFSRPRPGPLGWSHKHVRCSGLWVGVFCEHQKVPLHRRNASFKTGNLESLQTNEWNEAPLHFTATDLREVHKLELDFHRFGG